MSGRRLRDAVQQTLVSNGFSKDSKVVIAGLSNTYADYCVTYEEYLVGDYITDHCYLIDARLSLVVVTGSRSVG